MARFPPAQKPRSKSCTRSSSKSSAARSSRRNGCGPTSSNKPCPTLFPDNILCSLPTAGRPRPAQSSTCENKPQVMDCRRRCRPIRPLGSRAADTAVRSGQDGSRSAHAHAAPGPVTAHGALPDRDLRPRGAAAATRLLHVDAHQPGPLHPAGSGSGLGQCVRSHPPSVAAGSGREQLPHPERGRSPSAGNQSSPSNQLTQ